MAQLTPLSIDQGWKVNAYFQSQSSYWKKIYGTKSVQGEILRLRHAAGLQWIDSLGLPPGSRALDLGCGAGFMAVDLAQRGFKVQAMDSSEGMIDLARRKAAESGFAGMISLDVGDAHSLKFEDNTFDLVIAVGLIAWLNRPELAIQEMARVTRPGGHVILTAGNRAGLIYILDPLVNPALAPLKQSIKYTVERLGIRKPLPTRQLHPRRYIDENLVEANLIKIESKTLGFGPFTLFRRKILPDSLGVVLHHRLQSLADHSMPMIRSCGMSYLVMGRKPVSTSKYKPGGY